MEEEPSLLKSKRFHAGNTLHLFDQLSENTEHLAFLKEKGLDSLEAILAISHDRFVCRYGDVLQEDAGEIYSKAQSYAHQLYDRDDCLSAEDADMDIPQPDIESEYVAPKSQGDIMEQPAAPGSSDFSALPYGYQALDASPSKLVPDYQTLFPEDYAEACSPDSIASNHSPAAYLTWLYRLAKQITADKEGDYLDLDQRRPDLKELRLDQTNMTKIQPTLTLVNEILRQAAQVHVGVDKPLDRVLAETRYPFQLPFNKAWMQIQIGLATRDLTLNDLRQQLDENFPYYYLQSNRNDYATARALQISYNGWSPQQYQLQLEDFLFIPKENLASKATAAQKKFFLLNYGQSFTAETTLKQIVDYFSEIAIFLQHTGLSQDEFAVLCRTQNQRWYCVSKHCPQVKQEDAWIAKLGGYYINFKSDTEISVGSNTLNDLSPATLERYHRFIRLQQWTGLTYPDLNELFATLLRAVQKNDDNNKSYLRLIGVFRHLQQRAPTFTVQQMIAFIGELSPVGTQMASAFFDQVFNSNPAATPLVLDGRTLDLSNTDDTEVKQIIAALCSGLQITASEWEYLQKWMSMGLLDNHKLVVDARSIARLYRSVNIPRLFAWNLQEGLCLLDLLDPRYTQSLDLNNAASYRAIFSNEAEINPDVLDLLVAMEWGTDWLRHCQCQPSELVRILSVKQTGNIAIPPLFVPDVALLNCLKELRPAVALLPSEENTKNAGINIHTRRLHQVLASYYDTAVSIITDLLTAIDADFFNKIVKFLPEITDLNSLKKKQDLLDTLSRLAHYVALIKRLQLSVDFVQWWVKFGERFGLSLVLNLRTFYLITRYKDFLEKSQGDETACLDYFCSVDTLTLDESRQRLAQLLNLDFSKIPTLFLGEDKITRLEQLDRLLRFQALLEQTGLSKRDLQHAAQLQPERTVDQVTLSQLASAVFVAAQVKGKPNQPV